jgi:hypothetical protein
VWVGTVSWRETPDASWSPPLLTTRSQTRRLPGLPEPETSTLSIARLGEASTGVETVSQLLARGSPALEVETQAVLVIEDRVAETGEATRTVKVREAEAPAANGPIDKVHGDVPQSQPGELLPGTKLVSPGRVSERVTSWAEALPWLVTCRLQVIRDPGEAEVAEAVFERTRSGMPGRSGVESVAVLSEGSSSGEAELTVAELRSCVTPGGMSVEAVTAKMRAADPPATTVPNDSVQREPAPVPAGQSQPGELAAGENVEWAGTVSERVEPRAEAVPRFVAVRV